jgi:hypothetical protein
MITSHTGFQPLKEVWLGDCYPTEWYSDFDNKAQDIFGTITEITKQDLKLFEKKLQELGIIVRRPVFDDRSNYLDEFGNLCKPPITPRDWAMTLGDTLYVIPQYKKSFTGFESTIDLYKKQNQKVIVLDRSIPDPMCHVTFPSVVRVGRDILLDCKKDSPDYSYFEQVVNDLAKNYRVHITHTNEHNDSIFCPIGPNNIFSTHYRTNYKDTFPGWNIFYLHNTASDRISNGYNGNWWVPGKNYQIYNNSIVKYAQSWIGASLETVFEVNMLVVDENNIFCIAEDDRACQQLERMGITPHIIDFRCRGFWDGGLHCLTTDIHREGACLDYWPDRGSAGIYQ